MARRRYVVTYDVGEDRRRDRVFQILLNHGDHLQFSVFLCDLTERELIGMKGELRKALHEKEDQVLVIDLGPAETDSMMRIESLGRVFSVAKRVVVV